MSKFRSKFLNLKKIGQIRALGKLNSEDLELPKIQKYWSLIFEEMGSYSYMFPFKESSRKLKLKFRLEGAKLFFL